jgi:glycosyltransferase involved in cell wall biosynthesis
MNNPDLRDKMGKAGRDRVVKHYDYRVVAKRFVELLQERLGIE